MPTIKCTSTKITIHKSHFKLIHIEIILWRLYVDVKNWIQKNKQERKIMHNTFQDTQNNVAFELLECLFVDVYADRFIRSLYMHKEMQFLKH